MTDYSKGETGGSGESIKGEIQLVRNQTAIIGPSYRGRHDMKKYVEANLEPEVN